jgi:hypothetical protein
MTTLEEPREQLRQADRHWEYETRVRDKDLTESEKEEIAQRILDSPLPWARGLAVEIANR